MSSDGNNPMFDPFLKQWEEISNNIQEFFSKNNLVDQESDPTAPAFFEILDRLWQIERDPENQFSDQRSESWFHSFCNVNTSWNIQFAQPKVSGSPEDETWQQLLRKLEKQQQPFQRLEIRLPEVRQRRLQWFFIRIRQFFDRLINPYLQQIVEFTNNLLTVQQEFNQTVIQLQHEIVMRLLIERQISFNAEIVRLINQILQNILFSRQKRFNMVVKELLKHIPVAMEQNSTVLDQKIASLSHQKGELDTIRVTINRLLDAIPTIQTTPPRDAVGIPNPLIPESAKPADQNLYLQYENAFRGERATVLRQQSKYLNYFLGRTNVLDLGCGRGEFLELLKRNNVVAHGIESNPFMVEECRRNDLAVLQMDALASLAETAESSLGGIFSAMMIEHLRPESLFELIRRSFLALQPGAFLILETSNPVSLLVGGSTFHRDPTRVRLYHPETLKFLLEQNGFDPVVIENTGFLPESQRLRILPDFSGMSRIDPAVYDDIRHNFTWLNSYLCAPQEYAAIARKPPLKDDHEA